MQEKEEERGRRREVEREEAQRQKEGGMRKGKERRQSCDLSGSILTCLRMRLSPMALLAWMSYLSPSSHGAV